MKRNDYLTFSVIDSWAMRLDDNIKYGALLSLEFFFYSRLHPQHKSMCAGHNLSFEIGSPVIIMIQKVNRQVERKILSLIMDLSL